MLRDITSNPTLTMIMHIDPAALPEYVKTAGIDVLGVSADIPPEGFAYRLNGTSLLPCHNKAATFVSRLYFEAQRDQVDSTVARAIDAKLASFERLFAVDQDQLKAAVADMERVNAELPAQQQANKLACQYGMAPDSFEAEGLIRAARELKQAGATNMLVNEWVFDRPLVDASREIRKLASLYESEPMAELANELANQPPRRATEFIPKLANLLAAKLAEVKPYVEHDRVVLNRGRKVLAPKTAGKGNELGQSVLKQAGIFGSGVPVNLQVQRVLNQLPWVDNAPIRLVDQEVDPRRILPHLSKIATLTGLPLVSDTLQLPVDGWELILDTAPIEAKRTIVNTFTL